MRIRRFPFDVPPVVPDPDHGAIFWHPLELDVELDRDRSAYYVVETDPADSGSTPLFSDRPSL